MALSNSCRGPLLARYNASRGADHGPTSAMLAGLVLGIVLVSAERHALCADKPGEPTTASAAAKVLDLRTLPLPEGARPGGIHTMAILMYETSGTPKATFSQQLKQLTQLDWKELPGTYLDKTSGSAHLSKDGFIVALSSSDLSSDPDKAGRSSVTIVNHGNVDTAKLPLPPGVKRFYSNPSQASYLAEGNVADTAEACRKLLLAAGWEPYGTASSDPQSPMMYFKKNAIRLMAWVSTAPAQGNKTHLQYTTALLSADLPIPPDVPDPRYNDSDKTLRYDFSGEDTAPVVDFYHQELTAQGWKPTTDNPITDDDKGTAFLIFRNDDKELISVDMRRFNDIVRVIVSHQTAAELEVEERLAKEAAERHRQEMAKENEKTGLEVPLPPDAKLVDQSGPTVFEFEVAKGQGPAALQSLRKHFLSAGWTEEGESKFDVNHGTVELRKGEEELDFSYITAGFTPTKIRVSSSFKIELQPKLSAAAAPANEPAKTAKNKPSLKDIPGLADLPEGVELPDMPDVGELIKSVEEATGKKPAAAKGSAQKSNLAKNKASAKGTVQVADLPMPADAGVEYSKITKMIDVTSPADVETVANFFVDALTQRGWEKTNPGVVTASTGILKFSRAEANLTLFLHDRDNGTDVKMVTKGMSWDVVPRTKTIVRKKAPAKQSVASAPAAPSDEPKPAPAFRVVPQKVSVAEQKQTGVKLSIDSKTYKLEYGVAFQALHYDKPSTEVLLSVKPIAADKIAPLINQGKDGDDVLQSDPKIKLRFDENGKLDYLFLYADGLSVNLDVPGQDVVTTEMTVSDGRVRGKALLKKPGALFEHQYRFEAVFDCKLATAQADANSAPADDAGPAELIADDESGLPIPHNASSRMSTKSRYRQSVTAQVPEALAAVVAFYQKELPARGWKEKPEATKITSDRADFTFGGAAGDVVVSIQRQDKEVSIQLMTRDPSKAKAAGVTPQANRARLILGNTSPKEAVLTINGSPYKVAAEMGSKDPKDGVSLHVMPGKYTVSMKVPGEPDQSEEVRVNVGETWGMIVMPQGGFLADQLY